MTAYTPVKRAFDDIAAATTDSALVDAVAGKRIRVRFVAALAGDTETTIVFNSKGSGAGTAISPTFQNGINGGEVLGDNQAGWFETAVGVGLTATTGAGSTTGVLVGYEEV